MHCLDFEGLQSAFPLCCDLLGLGLRVMVLCWAGHSEQG